MKNNKTASLSLRKLLLSVLVTAPLATLPVPLQALPSSADNLASQVSSTTPGTTVNWTSATRVDVTSTATNSFIKWVNFGASGMTINNGDTINYALPSTSSSILNMVTGSSASTINGTLSSNGNIYVLNPNGVTLGSTGVISANGVGLSTVPETEYSFLNTGTLTGVENQNIATHAPVTVAGGAVITAASGTGNVWIAGQGASLSGTIDGGAVTVSSVRSGNVILGDSGSLVVGDVATHASTLSVTTDGGTIAVGNSSIPTSSVVVYGPSVSLTTGGNAAITQTGSVFQIGAGAGANASLTTNSGAGDTTLGNVVINGTGTLTVNSTGGNVSITSPGGKLAVGGNATGNFVATAAGDLTLNAAKVGNLSATSTTGSISAPGTVTTTGSVSLTVSSGKDIAYTSKAAPGSLTLALSSGTAFGNVTLVQQTGDLAVPTLTAASVTANAQGGNLTLAGAQSVTNLGSYSASGNVGLGSSVTAGNLTVTAGNDLNQTATVAGSSASSSTISYTATAGNVSITNTIGTAKSVTINAGKDITLAAAIATDTLSATAGNNLFGNSTINANTAAGGAVTLKATTGNVTTSSAGIIGGTTAPKTVTLNAGKNVTIGANITAGNSTVGTISATGANDVQVSTGTALNARGTTLAATAGNVTLQSGSSIASGNVTITAGQKIDDSGAISIGTANASLSATGNVAIAGDLTAGNATISGAYINAGGNVIVSGKTSVTSTDKIALTAANNDFGTIVLSGAPNGATVNDVNAIILGDGTAASGNVTINAAGITLGNTNSGTLSVAGNLTLNAGSSNISDNSNNITVGGPLNLNTSGAGVITLDGATGNGVGLNSSYGQVNATAGATQVTVFENTVLNLGNITAGSLRAYSSSGIVNTGVLTVGNVIVGAGTATAPGTIDLSSGNATIGNSISGTITILDDLHLLNPSSTVTGNYLASSLTVVNQGASADLIDLLPNVYGNTPAIAVSLTTTGSQNLNVGQLNTTGPVTLKSATGDIVAGNVSNSFTNVTVGSAGGNITVVSAKDLTVNATGITGAANATFTSGGNLTIGSFTSGTTGNVTFDTVASKGVIQDSVPGISIYGPVFFNGGSVNVTQAGHSFGGVSINTSGNNGNATIVESGYLKLVNVNTGKGAFTATSSNGGIFQSGGNVTTSGNATFNAQSAGVVLDSTTNNMSGAVAVRASTDSTISNTGALSLGSTTVATGNLTVSVANAGKDITQASGATIYSYGATSFTTNGGNITVNNSGNQFGGLTLASSNGNVTLKEKTTVNLKSVNTGTGFLNVTSEGGSIVDSGNVTVTGTSTFTANAGSILLTSAGSNYGTVKLNTTGNASITDTVGDLVMDTSTIGGSLDVTNTSGNISQAGALNVTGPTSFTLTGTASTLTLNNTANQFGPFRFIVGTGGALIDEATSFNLRGGSVSTGPVVINTGGDFLTSGPGGSSITNNLTINATGTIIPGAGSLLVTGTFTVNSGNLKDLSQLSKSGNLAGKDPVNQGTGTYTGPNP